MGEDGHEVTLLSLHESKHSWTNKTLMYKEVVANEAYTTIKERMGGFNIFKLRNSHRDPNKVIFVNLLRNLPDFCEAFLRDPDVNRILNDKPDIVLLPTLMNECGLAFVAKFDVPFIYISTSGWMPYNTAVAGVPDNPSFVPSQFPGYTNFMKFSERSVSAFIKICFRLVHKYYVSKYFEQIFVKFIPQKVHSMSRLEAKVALVLLNTHSSISNPRPLTPNVKEIGSLHCRPPINVSLTDPALQTFLDKSDKNKVLLFSFGSHIKGVQIHSDKLAIFMNVFKSLPYRVVWKFEGERPLNLSPNVLIRPWLPQQDVLGHPSVGAFISHFGQLSYIESVYHKVPMIGIPLMADQHTNAILGQNFEFAVILEWNTLKESTLRQAIIDVMEDSSYRRSVEHRSTLLKDQDSPLNRAVYWIEYVIKYNGAPHLRSAGSEISMIQYVLCDIFQPALFTFLIFIYIPIKASNLLFHITSCALRNQLVLRNFGIITAISFVGYPLYAIIGPLFIMVHYYLRRFIGNLL